MFNFGKKSEEAKGTKSKTKAKGKKSKAKGMSKEAVSALSYIQDAAASTKGVINVPVDDEKVIEEIRQHCEPDQLRRCCFGQTTLRGSVG